MGERRDRRALRDRLVDHMEGRHFAIGPDACRFGLLRRRPCGDESGRDELAALLRAGARERLEGLMAGHDAVALMEPMPRAPRLGAWAVRDPDPASPLMMQEIFGPVLSVIPYDDVDDAVAIANDSPYGLSGGVWGTDPEEAKAVARRIRTGQLEINGGSFNVGSGVVSNNSGTTTSSYGGQFTTVLNVPKLP